LIISNFIFPFGLTFDDDEGDNDDDDDGDDN
jgi:hypothetical protein